ncbi:hypothetical protein CA13_15360 [Planctomycetes bacterium CA13]|uniref:Uncharacterized protein n=2 Tax=Novipirellula herctigrandis TaxID=2527986 RepID=A0A5C5Z0A6_9BACT|nr:hypothetical protein CA13_15360 [Planctomycetes bacterium CA13]
MANPRVITMEPDASAYRRMVADSNFISRWALAHGSRDRMGPANGRVIATEPDASACRLTGTGYESNQPMGASPRFPRSGCDGKPAGDHNGTGR